MGSGLGSLRLEKQCQGHPYKGLFAAGGEPLYPAVPFCIRGKPLGKPSAHAMEHPGIFFGHFLAVSWTPKGNPRQWAGPLGGTLGSGLDP